MMALVNAPPATAASLAARFRDEARVGRVLPIMQPGHADGWGIAYSTGDERRGAWGGGRTTAAPLAYAGRSIVNAADDPEYPRAVERLAAARGPVLALAHVRKRTKGRLIVAHTHPFIEDGLALAHNGTVHDLASEGESDSAAILHRIVRERASGSTVEEAIAALAREVDKDHRYSSLTLLVTDGRALWGLRRIGNDAVTCAPEQHAAEYYTLGHATLPDGTIVVSQEHEVLGVDGWMPLADGEMVTVLPDGRVTTRRVV